MILNQKFTLYQNQAKEVILPGYDGELSVWDFHQAFLYRLKKGYIKIAETGDDSRLKKVFIRGGLAKMLNNNLTVLVQTL